MMDNSQGGWEDEKQSKADQMKWGEFGFAEYANATQQLLSYGGKDRGGSLRPRRELQDTMLIGSHLNIAKNDTNKMTLEKLWSCMESCWRCCMGKRQGKRKSGDQQLVFISLSRVFPLETCCRKSKNVLTSNMFFVCSWHFTPCVTL